MDSLPILSAVIKERRHKLGLTQKQLAEKLCVSDKAVSKWERGESMPDISLLPQIALVLDVSMDYLFSGIGNTTKNTENNPPNNKTRQKAITVSSAILQNKINTKYVIAIVLVLFSVFFCFFGQIVVLNNYISIVNWQYRSLLYSFIIVAIYFVSAFTIKKYKLILADDSSFAGQLDKVLAVASATAVYLVLMFHHITDYSFWSFIDRFGKIITQWLGATASDNNISFHLPMFMMSLCLIVYLGAVVANTLASEKQSTFNFAVIITSTAYTVMTVLHTVYYCLAGAVILKDRTYLYGFWLETAKVANLLHRLNIYNIIYAIVTLAIAAGFVLLIKEKPQRKAYILCTAPLWLYQTISAFGFINRNADGIGSYFAQFNASSIMLSLALVAAAPHIVMAVNGLLKTIKN